MNCSRVRLNDDARPYPGLEDLFPAAARMQRAAVDLTVLRSTAEDRRPWLRHAAWSQNYRPLVDGAPPAPSAEPSDYEFVRVQGEGVQESTRRRARRHTSQAEVLAEALWTDRF